MNKLEEALRLNVGKTRKKEKEKKGRKAKRN